MPNAVLFFQVFFSLKKKYGNSWGGLKAPSFCNVYCLLSGSSIDFKRMMPWPIRCSSCMAVYDRVYRYTYPKIWMNWARIPWVWPPSAMNIRLIKRLVGVGESYKPSFATVTGPTPNKGQWGSPFFDTTIEPPLPPTPAKKKQQLINKVVLVFSWKVETFSLLH